MLSGITTLDENVNKKLIDIWSQDYITVYGIYLYCYFFIAYQVKECTSALLRFAKKTNIPVILVSMCYQYDFDLSFFFGAYNLDLVRASM